MGAYICQVCDNVYCSHEVNYYHCDTCDTAFCEGCWIEGLHENQDGTEDICGECYLKELNHANNSQS